MQVGNVGFGGLTTGEGEGEKGGAEAKPKVAEVEALGMVDLVRPVVLDWVASVLAGALATKRH